AHRMVRGPGPGDPPFDPGATRGVGRARGAAPARDAARRELGREEGRAGRAAPLLPRRAHVGPAGISVAEGGAPESALPDHLQRAPDPVLLHRVPGPRALPARAGEAGTGHRPLPALCRALATRARRHDAHYAD